MKNFSSILAISSLTIISTFIAGVERASAIISADIFGVEGTGTTTWNFSGNTNAISSFNTNNLINNFGFGNYLPNETQNLTVNPNSGSLNISVDGLNNTFGVTSIFVDSDGSDSSSTFADDIRITLDSSISGNSGDTVAVTGAIEVPLDISSFNIGSFTDIGASGFYGAGEFVVTTSASASVPFEFSPTLGIIVFGSFFGASRLVKRRQTIIK